MRLLYVDDNGSLSLTQDLQDDIPLYAILSHTWGSEQDEVTLDDIHDRSASSRKAFGKITFCINQARQDGLRYVWIDTCCIDRRNLVELSEAINSMYKWYASASKCYVYLADVPSQQSDSTERSLEVDFRQSRWFTRGWCLQELLAPENVDFYTWHGQHLGSKRQHRRAIQTITGIDENALLGKPLSSFSIEKRFEWASRRQTKKPEDAIYCLLGIFDVTMPLNYAEGKEKARRRLNREIADNQHFAITAVSMQRPMQTKPQLDTASEGTQRAGEESRARGLAVLELLKFSGIDSRRVTIENPLEDTCSWILEHPAFRDWKSSSKCPIDILLDNSLPFLWIKGHPGAGKSTLIKYIDLSISSEIQDSGSDLLISFYFTARGHELERSVAGMYRTLIVQLCTLLPELEHVLGDLRYRAMTLCRSGSSLLETLAGLKELFVLLVRKVPLPRLYCIIDALDETDEDDVVEMVKFIRTLERCAAKCNVRLLVCFASRHYPTLVIPNSLSVILDGEDGHQRDLQVYVDVNLHISNSNRETPIKAEILTKANGIFMWVVLVVEILNKEYRRGNIMIVEKKLQQIPAKLGDLFQGVIQQGDVAPEPFLLCLRLILGAHRPLTVLQLYHAVISELLGREEYIKIYQDPAPTPQELNNFLVTNAKGLAEVVSNEQPEHMLVQFIHKSVPDFLLEHDGLSTILRQCNDSVPASSDEQIRRCCMHALIVWTPFSSYALSEVFKHADKAARSGVSQNEFCRFMIGSQAWFMVRDAFMNGSSRAADRHYSCEHLLTFTLIKEYYGLQRYILDHEAGSVVCSKEALNEALLYAAGTLNPDHVEYLIQAGADVNAKDRNNNTALHYVLAMNAVHLETGQRLIARQDACLVALGDLHAATIPFHSLKEKVCHILLQHDADINQQNHAGRTPLHLAVRLTTPAVAEILLRAGADYSTPDKDGQTAWDTAVNHCHGEYFQVLISQS